MRRGRILAEARILAEDPVNREKNVAIASLTKRAWLMLLRYNTGGQGAMAPHFFSFAGVQRAFSRQRSAAHVRV